MTFALGLRAGVGGAAGAPAEVEPSRGWYKLLRQGRGDHEIWTGPRAPEPFTVPVTIASRHTANKVLKDAGLPNAF